METKRTIPEKCEAFIHLGDHTMYKHPPGKNFKKIKILPATEVLSYWGWSESV